MREPDYVTRHPGEIIQEDFLDYYQWTHNQLAKKRGVHIEVVDDLINGRRSVDESMTAILAGALGQSAQSWLGRLRYA